MTSPRQLRRLLITSLLLANLLVTALSAYSLYVSRQQHLLRTESLTQNIATAVQQNLANSVERVDLALRAAVDELEQQLSGKGIDANQMTRHFARQAERFPEIEAFRVANAEGRVFIGKGIDLSNPATWADRDYFIHHRDHADERMYIAKLRMGRVSRQPIVGFSRRYNYPDGRFAGVVSAPIALEHFNRLLSRFDLGTHGTIVLRDADLGLITRVPPIPDQPAGEVGNASVSPELRQLVEANVASATYHTQRGADGYQRILTFQRLEKAPFMVIAASASDDYLADWQDEVYRIVAFACCFLALSLLSGGFISRQLLKAEARERMLNQSLSDGERLHASLKRLSEIAALSHLPITEQLEQALREGAALLKLEFGIVSQVDRQTYRIVAQSSPPDTLKNGQEFPLDTTYCTITLQQNDVLAIDHMANSPYAKHPCYEAFRLEAYIGTPIVVNGEVFGTANFSSPYPYQRGFDQTDREFVSLFARWVGSALEREQAQQDLAASQRHLQAIIENEPECVKVVSADGTLLQMNPAGLAMIEVDNPDQVIGRNVLAIIAAEHRDAFVQLHQRVLRGESGMLEFEVTGLKGTRRWLETHAVPMRDNAGEIIGQLAVTRDISERKRNEAELEKHRRHLEALVAERTAALLETETRASLIIESSAGGLYGIDQDGIITFMNPAAREMLGHTDASRVIGRSAHALLHHTRVDGSPYPAKECPSYLSLKGGNSVRVDDEVYWHADGHAVPVIYATHPLKLGERIVGAVTSFIDVSAQREAAEAHQKALQAAERLARTRSEFLANMSHEIRTPLNGVLGFAEIGQRNSQNPERARDAFGKILLSGRRLLGVINDILDFSKIEAGKMIIEQTPMDIAEVVEHALDLLRDRAESKGIQLRCAYAADLPAECLGDPLRTGQILINLLSNAVKFTEHGGVDLHVAQQGSELVFVVSDTGIGMDESTLNELFNPFQQADASSTRRFGGTGLGLAICKRILELMQGSISVRSALGQGTAVEFRLPYVPLPAAVDNRMQLAATHHHWDEQPLAGLSFLVAEDEPVNQIVLEDKLSSDGAQVTLVGNGREALERIQREGADTWDFVLMDIQMPEMDGYEATCRIHAIAPDLPIIAQTAHALAEEREKCLAAGMIGHLSKPIDMDALIRLVKDYRPTER